MHVTKCTIQALSPRIKRFSGESCQLLLILALLTESCLPCWIFLLLHNLKLFRKTTLSSFEPMLMLCSLCSEHERISMIIWLYTLYSCGENLHNLPQIQVYTFLSASCFFSLHHWTSSFNEQIVISLSCSKQAVYFLIFTLANS